MTTPAPRFPTTVRHQGTVYTSGLAALEPTTMTPKTPDFASQCADVLAQLDSVLRSHGSARTDILRLECFLADRIHFEAWNTAFDRFFHDSVVAGRQAGIPARTTTITTLPIDGLLIEVQAIARTPERT